MSGFGPTFCHLVFTGYSAVEIVSYDIVSGRNQDFPWEVSADFRRGRFAVLKRKNRVSLGVRPLDP